MLDVCECVTSAYRHTAIMRMIIVGKSSIMPVIDQVRCSPPIPRENIWS
jgi:hypothetical protein